MKFHIKSIVLICCLLLLVPVIFAQKQAPPEGGTPKDFKLPEKQTFALDNGLQVMLVSYGDLPKVTANLVIRAGNLNEAADEVWLADLTGDLMKEGTKTRSAQQVAQEAASMGGQVNINVGLDQTTISGDVLAEFGPDLIKLMADLARNPLLPESELPRLKKDMLRQLSIQKTQPQMITLEKFRQVMYGNHAYGRIFPTEAMIESFTIDKVHSFYNANFGAARARLYVAGRFDAGATSAAVREAFGDWQKGPDPLIDIPKPVTQRSVHMVDRPDAAQSTIYLGLPVVDPSHQDYMTLLVTNTLLGGFFSSRVTANIREDKGYTYSPGSSISSRYRDAYWVQVADVTTDVTGPALKEIFYEINRLQSEAPSEEELRGVQNYLAGVFVLQNSSRGGIINQLAFVGLHGLDNTYLTEYVKNVYAVTPADVQRMAQSYLRDEEMILAVTGDVKKIKKQVEDVTKGMIDITKTN
ncbi:insulinase family protein [candidate division KSB1 bacterium]|nr:insulinase family protein [candidate division KSB1 bacterium]